jgi:hypothetical protein
MTTRAVSRREHRTNSTRDARERTGMDTQGVDGRALGGRCDGGGRRVMSMGRWVACCVYANAGVCGGCATTAVRVRQGAVRRQREKANRGEACYGCSVGELVSADQGCRAGGRASAWGRRWCAA